MCMSKSKSLVGKLKAMVQNYKFCRKNKSLASKTISLVGKTKSLVSKIISLAGKTKSLVSKTISLVGKTKSLAGLRKKKEMQ